MKALRFAVVIWGLLFATALHAQSPIVVQDPSFETSAPVDDYNFGPVPGWACAGAAQSFGQWQPLARNYFTTIPDGKTVLYLDRASCSQDLGIVAQPATGYSVNVFIGRRIDGYDAAYTIRLQVAGVDLCPAFSGSSTSVPLGTFAPVALSCTTGAVVPTGNLTVVFANSSGEAVFDNVTVTTSGAVPPVAQKTIPLAMTFPGVGLGKGFVLTVLLETIPNCFLQVDGDCGLQLQVSMPASSCTTALGSTTCTASTGTIAIVKTAALPAPQIATVPLASISPQP